MEAKDVESRASDPTLSARPEGAPKARKLENVSAGEQKLGRFASVSEPLAESEL